jgi:hypothetical protein
MAAALIVGGMRLLSVHQREVAACQYRCHIALFQAFLVQMTAVPTTVSPYHNFYRLLGFGIKGEVWEVIALKMRVDG